MAGDRKLLVECKRFDVQLEDGFNKRTEFILTSTKDEEGMPVGDSISVLMEPYEIDELIRALNFMKQRP